jgi:hypothetical protein
MPNGLEKVNVSQVPFSCRENTLNKSGLSASFDQKSCELER